MAEEKDLRPEGQEQDDVYKNILERTRKFVLSYLYKDNDLAPPAEQEPMQPPRQLSKEELRQAIHEYAMKSPEQRALDRQAMNEGLSLAKEEFSKMQEQAQEATRGIKEISQGAQGEVAPPLSTPSSARAATQQRGVSSR